MLVFHSRLWICGVIFAQNFQACSNNILLVLVSVSEKRIDHRWMYPGICPHPVGNWSWVPFRNHCYSFILHELQFKHEAIRTCGKGNVHTQEKPTRKAQEHYTQ